MTKSNNEEYFVKFCLVKAETGMDIEIQSCLPTDPEIAMIFMGMLSQINTGECGNLILKNLYIEATLSRNELFQGIAENWQREIEERKTNKTSHSVVSPLRVFGESNL